MKAAAFAGSAARFPTADEIEEYCADEESGCGIEDYCDVELWEEMLEEAAALRADGGADGWLGRLGRRLGGRQQRERRWAPLFAREKRAGRSLVVDVRAEESAERDEM